MESYEVSLKKMFVKIMNTTSLLHQHLSKEIVRQQ